MGLRITGNYKSPRVTIIGPDYSGQYTVNVYDNDYSGAVTEVDILSCHVLWDAERGEDRHSPIVGSRATISINIPATDTTLTTFIEDFAYGEDARFTVEIVKVGSPTDVWRGVLKADQSGEDDIDPFPFKLSAVCGLSLLKDIPYLNDTPPFEILYFGIKRFTEHLTNALSKMPHSSFWSGSEVFIRTAVDWWSASMTSGADEDPLYQSGVDHVVFHDFTVDGGIQDDVVSCYVVVSEIMKAFGCRIYQSEGHWRIDQIPYRSTSPYYTRDYTKTGTFISSATNTGTNLINQTIAGAKITLINYDFLPILKKAQVTYNAKRRRNLLNGKNLGVGNDTITFNQLIDANGGDSTFRIRGTVNFGIKNNTYSGGVNDKLFIVPNFRLKIGSNYLLRDYTISNYTATLKNCNWDANSGNRVYLPHQIGTVPTPGNQVNGVFSFEVLTTALPADGDLNTFLFSIGSIIKWNGTAANDAEFTKFWSVNDLYLDVFDEGVVENAEDQVVYEAVNPLDATEIYKTELKIGFSDTQVNALGRIFYNNSGTWEPAPLWGQGTDPRTSYISDILALNILNGQASPRRRMNGTLDGNFRIHRLIQTSDGRHWMFTRVEWDLALNRMTGSWVELDYGVDGVSSTPVKKKIIYEPTHPTPDPKNPTGLVNTAPGFSINPAPAVLAPVAYNQLDGEIAEGAAVTTIPLKTASLGNEFLAGDGVTLVNPYTGQYQTFIIDTPPILGDTSLSVISQAAISEYPEDSYLVVKQNAYAFSLPNANQGEILRFNSVTDEWEAYGGTTDGNVLTWDTTNGWQSETPTSGGTVTSVAAAAPAAGFTIAGSPITTAGTLTFSLANDLAALEGMSGTGIVARTAAETYAQRTLTAGAGISITDGDGVSGNPTISSTVTAGYNKIRDNNTLKTQRESANFLNTATVSWALADDAVDAETEIQANVIDASITAAKLASDSVTTVKILDGNVTTAKVANDAITYDKIQNVTTNRVLGRVTAGAGDVQELGPGTSMAFLSSGFIVRKALTGDVTAAQDSNATTIAADAVTNTKLANMAANSIKGNNTGAAADPKDLTVAEVKTLLGFVDGNGNGVANRIAYWTGTGTISSDAAFTIDAVNDRLTITGTVAGLGANNAFLNLNSGAIAGATEFLRASGNITNSLIAGLYNANNVAATSNSLFVLSVGGANGGDPVIQFNVNAVVTHSIGIDNSDADKFKITPNSATPGGVADSGLIITNAAVALVGINKDAPAHPLDVSGRARSTQFINDSVAGQKPTVGTLGTGLGTGPAINDVSGSNNGFSITFTTGTTPTAGGDMFTVTFATSFPAMSFPVFCQGNDNAAAEFSKFSWSARAGANFTLKVRAGQTLTASTQYVLLFSCFGI